MGSKKQKKVKKQKPPMKQRGPKEKNSGKPGFDGACKKGK